MAGVQRRGERREGSRDQMMGSFLWGAEEKAEKEGTGLEEEAEKGSVKEEGGREEGGQSGWGRGPSTHVGKEEQDASQERDDLSRQPQVVHGGAVRVRRLRGQVAHGSSPSPSNIWPLIQTCPNAPPTPGSCGPSSLTLFPLSAGEGGTPPSCSSALSCPSHRGPRPGVGGGPSCAPAPARLAATHSALQWLVVGGEGEDDHGAQIGDHVDVEGDSPELAPLVPQQFIDGLHGQHLVAVLWETG